MAELADNLALIRERIARAAQRSGRAADEVEMVAVSKTVGADSVREAVAAGVRIFGENRAQELRRKSEALSDLRIDWHFVGQLQTNKARLVVPVCRLIHSVDRPELAAALQARISQDSAATPRPLPILVQVNTTDERTKAGVSPDGLASLLDEIAGMPDLRVDGLMTIGPLTTDGERMRRAFRSLRAARDRERARGRAGMPLGHLSMGMSADFECAIEEGATLVRLGTALFGARAV